VVGSGHRGVGARTIVGSVGERLAQSAPCAVGVAPRGHQDGGLGVVGVAYDGTAEAQSALHGALPLAVGRGARLRLVSVVDPPNPAFLPSDSADYAAFRNDLRLLRRGQLRRGSATVTAAGLRVETELLDGSVIETLIDQTASLDLLALGSRRYGALRRIAAGSVSIGLLRGAACPVLVLPRGVNDPFGEFASCGEAVTPTDA
jgi:nucleotide-binding universal stress UspA family protein